MSDITERNLANQEELEYEEARRLVRERMRARMRNGACCDEIEARLWLPELTRRNVTIFCDRLVLDDIKENRQAFIVITTRTGDIGCFSYWNIEEQSSGFRLKDYLVGEERRDPASVILDVNPTYVKEELVIPNNVRDGYYKLGETKNNLIYSDNNSRKVSTSLYGHQYILNFTVGGEFNLEIGYFTQDDDDIRLIFKRGFCCK